MSNAYEIVKKARSSNRLRSKEVIERLFEDIVYLKGDRCFGGLQNDNRWNRII